MELLEERVEQRILDYLEQKQPQYESAITSEEIGRGLNLTPAYVREKMRLLVKRGLVRVRRGAKGGYYLMKNKELILEIDGQQQRVSLEKPFVTFYNDVCKELNGKGRVITEIRVNGVKTLDEYIADLDGSEVREVAMITMPQDELIDEMIEAAIEYLPKLHAGLGKVAQHFQSGNIGEGADLFVEAVEGIQWVNGVIQGVNNHPAVVAKQLEKKIMDGMIRFNDVNVQLLEAWENQDFVLLADLLEYEYRPVIETWQDLFQKMLQK